MNDRPLILFHKQYLFSIQLISVAFISVPQSIAIKARALTISFQFVAIIFFGVITTNSIWFAIVRLSRIDFKRFRSTAVRVKMASSYLAAF